MNEQESSGGMGTLVSATIENPVVMEKDETSGIINVSLCGRTLNFEEWKKLQQDNYVMISEDVLNKIRDNYSLHEGEDMVFNFKILPSLSTLTLDVVEKKAAEKGLSPLTLNEIFHVLSILRVSSIRSMNLRWLFFMNDLRKDMIYEFSATDSPEIKLSNPRTVFNSQVGFAYK